MFCNNFGYYSNMLSQMMLPTLMMQGMYSSGNYLGGLTGGYSPMSIFMQPYSSLPIMPSYSYMPSLSFMPATFSPMMNFTPSLNFAPYGGGYSSSIGNYFDFLGATSPKKSENPQKTNNPDSETEKFYVNTDENGVKRNPFDAFEKMEEVITELGYEKANNYSDKKAGVQITDDAWRTDANAKKPDVEANYMTQVKDFGKKFIEGIDKKHGNADGVLSYEEFEKYQLEDIPSDADAETKAEMKKSSKIAFDRLNLNKGDTIDEKEITTLLAAMDYDKDNNVNGIITINDFMRTSVQLSEKGKNLLDDLLKNRYNAFFDKNA